MPDSIMIVGSAGSVGHDIMYLIASRYSDIRVIGADVNEEVGRREIEESLHIAHNMGNYPDLGFRKIDLFDIPRTAELLKELQPSVICNLASLGSWWVTRLLPPEVYEKIRPIGPWLPNHLALAHNLMKSVKKAGIRTRVVNGAFPDLVNVVLSRVSLGPDCGGGNMDLACSRIKRLVAREKRVPYRSVSVYGVGHHGSFYTAGMKGPFWMKILIDGVDVSDEFTHETLRRMYEAAGYTVTPQLKGPLVDQMRTAASFLKHVLAIYFDTKEVHQCVAGPNGLPGAYPARLGLNGAEVVLPGLSLEEAVSINVHGARLDGIEQVKDNGTVVYSEESVRLMREVLGYECTELRISEAQERADELNSRLEKLYEKHRIR